MTRTPYYERDGIVLYVGDCLEVAPELDAESVSAVVTDPPYGLGFMGKAWDKSVPGVPFWTAFMHAMKPGAHLLAFGGSRTYHRMGVAIEDAGLELRDTLMWLYGSGFPKSHDVSKAIDKANGKYAVDLAPFGEYVRECRKAKGLSLGQLDDLMDTNTAASWWEGRKSGVQLPGRDTYNRLKSVLDMDNRFDALIEWEEARREVIGKSAHKSGIGNATNGHYTVGGTKAEHVDITAPATPEAAQWAGWGTALKPAHEPIILARKPLSGTVAANVLAHGTGALNIDACRISGGGPKGEGGRLKAATGSTSAFNGGRHNAVDDSAGRWPANVILDEESAMLLDAQSGERGGGFGKRGASSRIYGGGKGFTEATGETVGYGDTGGASRFFKVVKQDDLPINQPGASRMAYHAKASRKERNAGLDGMPLKRKKVAVIQTPGVANDGEWEDGKQLSSAMANHHPTVKPLALMRYLVTLVTPPGGIVLDPFAGSGSTLVACAELGFPAIGIELSEEYCEIIARRVDHALNERPAVVQPSLLEMVAD